MKIIIFENKNVENLYPLTLTRPSFGVLCGGVNLYQALKLVWPKASIDFLVRPELEKITERDFHPDNAGDKQVLFIDGAVVPSIKTLKGIDKKISQDKDFSLTQNGRMIALYSSQLDIYVKLSQTNFYQYLENLKFDSEIFSGQILENIWDPIVYNKEILRDNLEYISESYSKSKNGVFVGDNVDVKDHVVFDSSEGNIVIDDNVAIEPFSELKGPLYIGSNSIIRSFSKIIYSTIGPVCRVGGEIAESIIQGYSNKQHHGFLGNSYIGSWVNIGGGTSNSDLKNTYGKIKMIGKNTDQIHLGCIIGDYSKASINTSIFTGKVIGVASNLFGNILTDVPSFVNHGFKGELIEHPLDIATKTQSIVAGRRDVEFNDIDKDVLSQAFNKTVKDRKKSKSKKGKLKLS